MTQQKRASGRFERILEPPKLAQRSGAARPGVGIVGRERRRRFERRKRLGETALGEKQLAGVEMGDGQGSVELDRAAIEAQSRLGLAALAEHIAAHAQSGGEIGLEPQGLVDERDRLVAPAIAPLNDGGGVERLGPGLARIHRRPATKAPRLRGPCADPIRPRLFGALSRPAKTCAGSTSGRPKTLASARR